MTHPECALSVCTIESERGSCSDIAPGVCVCIYMCLFDMDILMRANVYVCMHNREWYFTSYMCVSIYIYWLDMDILMCANVYVCMYNWARAQIVQWYCPCDVCACKYICLFNKYMFICAYVYVCIFWIHVSTYTHMCIHTYICRDIYMNHSCPFTI